MNSYNRQYTFNTKYKKTKKMLVAFGIVLLLCFVAVTVIGLIADSDSVQNMNINSAIAENTQLKYKIEEQNEQIAELNEQINNLKMQIENGGEVQNEEPYMPDEEQTHEEAPQALQNNPTTPRDEIDG